MRSAPRWLRIAVAVLVIASLSAACAEQPAEEHDHSTHSHDEEGADQSGTMQSMSPGHVMAAAVEAPEGMSVSLHVEADAVSGLNVRLTTTGFTFRPQSVNAEDEPGTGHAHLYVDGTKITRLYGPYYHLAGVPPGEHEVRVALNTNSHADYIHGVKLVDAVQPSPCPSRTRAARTPTETARRSRRLPAWAFRLMSNRTRTAAAARATHTSTSTV